MLHKNKISCQRFFLNVLNYKFCAYRFALIPFCYTKQITFRSNGIKDFIDDLIVKFKSPVCPPISWLYVDDNGSVIYKNIVWARLCCQKRQFIGILFFMLYSSLRLHHTYFCNMRRFNRDKGSLCMCKVWKCNLFNFFLVKAKHILLKFLVWLSV